MKTAANKRPMLISRKALFMLWIWPNTWIVLPCESCFRSPATVLSAVDCGKELRPVDLLLEVSVDNAQDRGDPAAHLASDLQVLDAIVADRADIELRGQPEIQNRSDHVGRLEIEGIFRKCGR